MINDLPKTESKSNSQEESRSEQQHPKERKKIEIPVILIMYVLVIVYYVKRQNVHDRSRVKNIRKRVERGINALAVHEAGHAVMAYSSRYIDVDHVTIDPRGRYKYKWPAGMSHGHLEPTRIDGGMKNLTKEEMEDYIDMYHSGDVAEEIVFGSDGQRSENHDSEKIDFILSLFSPEKGKEWRRQQKKESRRRTKEFLTQHRAELDMLAAALISQKTLQNKDVTNLFQGSTLVNKGAVETDGVETTNKGQADFIQSTKLINTGAEEIVEVYFPNKAQAAS